MTSELMTFRSGDILFGIPITQVLTITGEQEILHCKAFAGKETLGISEYQGVPVAIVDLARTNNITSTNETKKEWVNLLKLREQDHIDWINALEDTLVNGTPFSKARDPHKCAFGEWYDNFKSDDQELSSVLAEFDAPHRKIHALADKLLDLKANDDIQACLTILSEERNTTLKYLLSLFERMRSQILSSIRTVYIYLTIDGATPCVALCVDEITDVETVVESGFTSMSTMALPTDQSSLQYLSGYQKLTSDNDCLLVDLELLLSNPSLSQKHSQAS